MESIINSTDPRKSLDVGDEIVIFKQNLSKFADNTVGKIGLIKDDGSIFMISKTIEKEDVWPEGYLWAFLPKNVDYEEVKAKLKLKMDSEITIYYGAFSSVEDIIREFNIIGEDKETLLSSTIIYAEYDSYMYEGDAYVLFRAADNKFYEVSDSHCSCMGLEYWVPKEISLIGLLGTEGTDKLAKQNLIKMYPQECLNLGFLETVLKV